MAGVGVVGGQVHARGRRPPRLGDTDREDRVLAAVLPVRGLEDEPVAVAAGRLPADAVPDLDPVRAANVWRFFSISGRDGNDEVPSISAGIRARFSGSSASRLFQS